MKCKNCNEENLSSAIFCKNCGKKLFQAENPVSQKGKNNNVVIGIVILVIILVIGTILVFANKNVNTSQQASNQTQSATTQNPTSNKSASTSKKDKVATDSSCGGQVLDADGNTYGTVQVGTQCWMAANMNVGKYISGSKNLTDKGKIEKWCPDDLSDNCYTDGGLYSWDEAMQYSTKEGSQGICPAGWHIPTDAEQYTLENYLTDSGKSCDANREGDGCASAGKQLLPGGSSGMNVLLGGFRVPNPGFNQINSAGYFWSSSLNPYDIGSAIYRALSLNHVTVNRNVDSRDFGYSVRCIKNN